MRGVGGRGQCERREAGRAALGWAGLDLGPTPVPCQALVSREARRTLAGKRPHMRGNGRERGAAWRGMRCRLVTKAGKNKGGRMQELAPADPWMPEPVVSPDSLPNRGQGWLGVGGGKELGCGGRRGPLASLRAGNTQFTLWLTIHRAAGVSVF